MKMASIYQIKKQIVEIGQQLYYQGLLPGGSGNISVRTGSDQILVTPSGISKGLLKFGDLILLNSAGKKLEGSGTPTSELPLHLFVYQQRKDVNAIIHYHPPIATAFSVAEYELPPCVLPEVIINLGQIPTTEYATPSTSETVDAIKPFVLENNAILLKNHGVVVFGNELNKAMLRAETVEHFAKVILTAHLLGKISAIPKDSAPILYEMQSKINNKYSVTLCEQCGICPQEEEK
ncbi:class II aldolase/adducin family protein [bacterium]|nr:class II aldolase/adducin family protein [bacterium]